MSQALPTATPEQILEFKKGAAARYKEQGISPADATRLFDAHMSKLANDLGLTSKPLSPKAQKIAAAMKTIIKQAKPKHDFTLAEVARQRAKKGPWWKVQRVKGTDVSDEERASAEKSLAAQKKAEEAKDKDKDKEKKPGRIRSAAVGAGRGALAGGASGVALSALAELLHSRRYPHDPFAGAGIGAGAGGLIGSVIGANK